MSRALEEMRINYERSMMLKNIENASNPLLKRRLERINQTMTLEQQQQQQQQVQPATGSGVKRRHLEDGRVAELVNSTNAQEQQQQQQQSQQVTMKKPSPATLKRMLSAPVSKTPLCAFYYTSNLKGELPGDECEKTFTRMLA